MPSQSLSAWYFQPTTCHLEHYSAARRIGLCFSCKTFWQTADKDLSLSTAILFSYLCSSEAISLQTKLFCMFCAHTKNTEEISPLSQNATCQMDFDWHRLQRIRFQPTNFQPDVLGKSGLPVRHKELSRSLREVYFGENFVFQTFDSISGFTFSLNLWAWM